MPETQHNNGATPVWDIPVRFFHWTLVLLIAFSWLSGEMGWMEWHLYSGYAVLTLVLFRIPTGLRAWIEDVVVDASARGAGVGEALNRFALDQARSAGATTVDLTSRPSREAANRLYRRLGFVQRETNVYRYEL